MVQAPKPQQDGKIRAASSAAPPDVPEAEDLDVYLRPARGRGGGEGAGARSPEERARDALRSPRRLGLYGYLGLVLVGTCVYEVAFAETPSAFHLGLYGFLSVCLAGNFLAERKHLDDDN